MNVFGISHSEAILLGRCLEIYLQESFDSEDARFIDHIRAEIRGFLPNAENSNSVRIIQSAPDDVVWSELPSGQSTGEAESTPNSVFVRLSGSTIECYRTPRKKTLDLLVVDWIADLLDEKTLRQERSYTCDAEQWRADQTAFLRLAFQHLFDVSETTSVAATSTAEDSAAIEARLKKLVAHPENSLETQFEWGRQLGALESSARRILRSHIEDLAYIAGENIEETIADSGLIRIADTRRLFGKWNPTTEETWHLTSIAPLERLLSEALPISGLSQTLLRKLLVGHKAHIPQGESSPGQYQSHESNDVIPDEPSCVDWLVDHFQVQESIRTLYFVLGELTGLHRAGDAAAVLKDLSKPVPRIAKLSRNSTADKILGHLELVEAWFSMDVCSEHLPSAIISELHNAIEPLAKRNWPEDFGKGNKKDELSNCLSKRRKFGNEQEQEFAGYAQVLFRGYRNQTAHDIDSTDYSMQKALLFMYGIRTLLNLSDTIVASRRKDS